MATGMWMSIRCEYFDKWPDWTLKHFIWHVVYTMGREGGEDEVGWGFGHCVGQCVAFWSFIWTLVLFHCQLQCRLSRSTPKLSLSLSFPLSAAFAYAGWEWVCGCMREHAWVFVCVCECATPNERPPSGAHHGEWQISKVPMDICNRTAKCPMPATVDGGHSCSTVI